MTDRADQSGHEPAPHRRARPRPSSLKQRITRNVAVLVTIVLTLMTIASTLALRTILDQQLSNQLRSAADRAEGLLTSRAAATVNVGQVVAAAPAGSFVVCLGADGAVVASAIPDGIDQAQLVARAREAAPQALLNFHDLGRPVRATLIPIDTRDPLLLDVGGETVTVSALVIGFDTSRAERVLRETALLGVGFALVACVLIVLLLPATLERGLRPIGHMTEAARAIAEGDVERRLPIDADAAETVILAHAVNDAIGARQDAENRLRQFVADASHELRTPLTTIDGWAELHRQGGLNDPELVDRAMARIADSAAHLTGLVQDLSLLARLDAGRPVAHAPVNLAAVAETVADDIRVIDVTREVTVTVPPAGGSPAVVEGDEQRLRQVVLNLLGNALQHTPAGTPITVEVGRVDDRVTLAISDAGPGIAPEHQARVFDRFYRAGSTRPGGTGLGLSIVRSLVDAHGGAIELHSDPAGTCFTVVLPALARA